MLRHYQPYHALASMWWSPRATIRQLHEQDNNTGVLFLAACQGLFVALVWSQLNWLGRYFLTHEVLIGCLVAAPFIGFALLIIVSRLLYSVSGFLGGSASFAMIRRAYGWLCLPTVLFILLKLVTLAMEGHAAFTPSGNEAFAGSYGALIVSCLHILLLIWGSIISCKIIGETARFSAWKGLLALLITTVLLVIAFVLVLGIVLA